MTRKHFVRIAGILAGDLATCSTEGERLKVRGIALSLADMFLQENSNFDRQRFYAAVGIEG
jgi:hypothetical protein